MAADRTKEALARISKARAALILDRPFFASLALRLGAIPLRSSARSQSWSG